MCDGGFRVKSLRANHIMFCYFIMYLSDCSIVNTFSYFNARYSDCFSAIFLLRASYLLFLLLWFICRPPIKDIVLALVGLFEALLYLIFCTLHCSFIVF